MEGGKQQRQITISEQATSPRAIEKNENEKNKLLWLHGLTNLQKNVKLWNGLKDSLRNSLNTAYYSVRSL